MDRCVVTVLISADQIPKKTDGLRGSPVPGTDNFFYNYSVLIDDKAFIGLNAQYFSFFTRIPSEPTLRRMQVL